MVTGVGVGDLTDLTDLTDRVHGALRFAAAAVDAVTRADGCDTGDFPDVRPLVAAKVLGETCLLLRAAYRAAQEQMDDRLAAAVLDLASTVEPQVRGTQLLASVCVRPDTALDEAFGHLHLRAIGLPDASVDALIEAVLPGDAHPGLERTPTRAVEQQWLRELWDPEASDGADARSRVLAASVLGRPLDPLTCTTLDLYSFTHLVMYASDSGRRPTDLPRSLEAIAGDAETALAVALDRDDLDLAAEALWTWPMLGLPWSPLARFAWHQVASAMDARDFVPGPDFDEATHDGLPAGRAADYRVATSYHSTIVMGILCSSMLSASMVSASMVIASKTSTRPASSTGLHDRWHDAAPTRIRAGAQLRCLVDDAPETRSWTKIFNALQPDEQTDLEPFLFHVALRRAAQRMDVDGVRRALQAGLSHGLLDSPATPAAVAFLGHRVALARALELRSSRAQPPATAAAAAAALATQPGGVP